ncbi:hypothetical protein SD71_04505 [Cohnella kolymensis]|uniref:Uncharacterized protein n=1 Tax=Cohnella kolymensis TaxID=1590652 RepID=A0ABR5A819_9BACL|nr:hypothetical protein SD71_04505 [Cohnella kolymensis]
MHVLLLSIGYAGISVRIKKKASTYLPKPFECDVAPMSAFSCHLHVSRRSIDGQMLQEKF